MTGRRVIGDALGELAEPALQRDRHRVRSADRQIFAKERIEQPDRLLDPGDVSRGAQTVLALRIDRVGYHACGAVNRAAEHLRLERDAVELEREIQLRRRHQFDAVGAVVGRIYLLLQIGEIELVVTQIEPARVPILRLKLQRPVQIARPDVEGPVFVGQLYCVVYNDAVDDIQCHVLHGNPGQGIVADVFHAPLVAGGRNLREHVGQGRRGDDVFVGVKHRIAAGEAPATVGVLNTVVENDRAAIDDLAEIGRVGAVLQRRGAGRGRPHLLELPVFSDRNDLRQHVLHGRTRDNVAVGVEHGIAGLQGPVAALRILHVDGAVQQHGVAVGILAEQHRIEFAGEIEGLAPFSEYRRSLLDERGEVRRRHGRGRRCHQIGEVEVIGGGDGEVGDRAETLGVDDRSVRPGGRAAFALVDRIGRVGGEGRVVDLTGRAIGVSEA